ncbi:hypothetical protein MOQ_008806 [Trypanosoma cruzi marinkellei]|uniref:Uncharacterized protein n=1 Tax=Trypanosoma cruzi marinkellei TaxID=85056 RepID=K2MJW6_TRYCR|nr:hypothetical protein MOQ_008806 [Trypanosoma cruzi marinkellei]
MVMYDPAVPNNYRDVKVMCWKRAREDERKNDISRSLAAAAEAGSSPFDMPDMMIRMAPRDELAYDILGGSGETMSLHLSAEELHQRRVRQSAALGITTAMNLEREELEAAHKARVAAGMDRKGRIGQKLGKLMSVAATRDNATKMSTTGDQVGDGVNTSGGEMTSPPPPPTATTSTSLAGMTAPLVFQRSELAAGGYVVREDVGALEKRKTHYGKPSSTILIRFIRDGPPVEVFDDTSNKNISNVTLRNAFLENIQDLCGQCGVVRSLRYVVLDDEKRTALRARLEKEKEEISTASADVETRLTREMVRVLVRFDTVANAFKALEMLQQRHGSDWDVCFFSTQLFDAGALGPAEGESLCCA